MGVPPPSVFFCQGGDEAPVAALLGQLGAAAPTLDATLELRIDRPTVLLIDGMERFSQAERSLLMAFLRNDRPQSPVVTVVGVQATLPAELLAHPSRSLPLEPLDARASSEWLGDDVDAEVGKSLATLCAGKPTSLRFVSTWLATGSGRGPDASTQVVLETVLADLVSRLTPRARHELARLVVAREVALEDVPTAALLELSTFGFAERRADTIRLAHRVAALTEVLEPSRMAALHRERARMLVARAGRLEGAASAALVASAVGHLARAGDTTEAIRLLDAEAERFDLAAKAFAEAADHLWEVCPEREGVRSLIARAWCHAGRADDALGIWDGFADEPLAAIDHAVRVKCLFVLGRYAEVVDLCEGRRSVDDDLSHHIAERAELHARSLFKLAKYRGAAEVARAAALAVGADVSAEWRARSERRPRFMSRVSGRGERG